MDSQFLKEQVGPVLAEGLAQVVLQKPQDKVDFLANWLLKYVEIQEQKVKTAQIKEKHAAADAVVEKQEQQEREIAAAAEQLRQADAEDKKQVEAAINAAATPEEAIELFLAQLQRRSGALASYAGRFLPEEDKLAYVAASAGHEKLLDERLDRDSGVTLDLFAKPDEAPAEEEEEVEDETEEAKAARLAAKEKKAREIKSLYIPNVLVNPLASRLKFYNLPNVGAYIALRVSYKGLMNNESLDDAVEKRKTAAAEAAAKAEEEKAAAEEAKPEEEVDEEEEKKKAAAKKKKKGKKEEKELSPEEEAAKKEAEEKAKAEAEAAKAAADAEKRKQEEEQLAKLRQEIIGAVPRRLVEYALCFDTIGKNKAFSPIQVQELTQYASILQSRLEAIDISRFNDEVDRRLRLSQAGPVSRTEEELTEKKNELKEELGEDIKDDDINFVLRKEAVLHQKDVILDFGASHVFKGQLNVLQALLQALGVERATLIDKAGRQVWPKIRSFLNADLISKIETWNPRTQQVGGEPIPADASLDAIANVLGELTEDEVKEQNYPLAEILGLVRDSLALRKLAQEQKEQAEAEAKAKAEAEAAAAAEAAALAAEKAAAEAAGESKEADGEGDADEEEEEEEEEDS